ncbi:MAG: tripartite tricarboxylate transporter substrate binding protein [Burkholderiaceae bacterium]|nr:tripartite tricarboxylate transporter substrate binding protein [Burkholderiaceae bacterium]
MNPRRLLLAVALSVSCGAALAQFPPGDRPIHLIVPFTPGSGTDTAARLLAEELAPVIKRRIVVDNRAGASGTIGTASVAKSPPDGLTLVMIGGTGIVSAPFVFRNLPYDPVKDLKPVYFVASSPLALFVAADSPARSFQDLIDSAKAQPGKLTYAAHNITNRVAMEVIKQSMSVDVIHVPYKSMPQALGDVATGRVTAMFNDLSGSAQFVAAGKIRPLAIMRRARSPRIPDVPTVYEFGYRGHEVINWTGVFAPAGTPPEIVEFLANAIRSIAQEPRLVERFENLGLGLRQGGTPESLENFVRQDIDAMGKVIRHLEIVPE